MIDRKLLDKVMNAVEAVSLDAYAQVTLHSSGNIKIWLWPIGGSNTILPTEARHRILAVMTTLVGKMEKKQDLSSDIDFVGKTDTLSIRINRVDVCKIVGYKITKKIQPKMIDSGEMEEIVEKKAISDCDIKSGKFSEKDIEVPA